VHFNWLLVDFHWKKVVNLGKGMNFQGMTRWIAIQLLVELDLRLTLELFCHELDEEFPT
jgi:hypothetical protein